MTPTPEQGLRDALREWFALKVREAEGVEMPRAFEVVPVLAAVKAAWAQLPEEDAEVIYLNEAIAYARVTGRSAVTGAHKPGPAPDPQGTMALGGTA